MGETCLTHHLWQDLSDQIHAFLSNITLADLVSKREIEVIAKNQSERAIRLERLQTEGRLKSPDALITSSM